VNYTKRVYMLVLCAALCAAAVGAQSTQTQSQTAEQPGGSETGQASEDGRAASGESASGAAAGEVTSDSPGELREEELEIRDTGSPQVELEGGLTQFSFWDFLRMFLVLGLVIGAIYGIFFVLKRMGNPQFQGNSLISLVSTQNLQSNRALHLVEVGNEVFLIGSSEGGVELVGRIEDRETLDQIRLYRSEMMAGGRSFQNSIRDIFSRGGGGPAGASATEDNGNGRAGRNGDRDEPSASALFLQKQRERLKNL
jgi:flagellar protein FliO/FliZ